MAARTSPEDLNLAREFIFKSTNIGKWNKPHLQAAASAMAWFIRELPGSPLLMNRLLRILGNHSDAAAAMSEATNLIRAQSLDASILNADVYPPTSTQAPMGAGRSLEEVLEEDLDLDASLIPPGQPATAVGDHDGSKMVTNSVGTAVVNDNRTEQGRTASTTFTPAPAAVAAAAAAGIGVAAAGVATAAAGDSPVERILDPRVHKTIPDVHKTEKKTPVCSYLWRRMLCRRSDCKSRHPQLCANRACLPVRSPDCNKFHGHFRAEKGLEEKEKGKPYNSHKPRNGGNGGRFGPNQGNGGRGAAPPTSRFSSRSNNRSATARQSGGGDNRRELEKSRRELERTMGELRGIKGTLGTLGSLRAIPGLALPHSGGTTANNSSTSRRTYSAAVKSGRGQHHNSFAEIVAAAVESALVSAGIRPHYV